MVNGSGCVAFGGKPPVWNNDDSNYAQWGATKYGPEPLASEMLTGVVCGSITGDVTLPDSVANVLQGTSYGSQAALNGTYIPVLESDVEEGVGYGASDEFTGTFVVPAVEDVELGVDYGNAAEFTGTLVAGGGGMFTGLILQE